MNADNNMTEHNLSRDSRQNNTTVTPTSSRLLMHDYNIISWRRVPGSGESLSCSALFNSIVKLEANVFTTS